MQYIVELVQQEDHVKRCMVHQLDNRIREGQWHTEITFWLHDAAVTRLDSFADAGGIAWQHIQDRPQDHLIETLKREFKHPVAVYIDKQRLATCLLLVRAGTGQ